MCNLWVDLAMASRPVPFRHGGTAAGLLFEMVGQGYRTLPPGKRRLRSVSLHRMLSRAPFRSFHVWEKSSNVEPCPQIQGAKKAVRPVADRLPGPCGEHIWMSHRPSKNCG
jgi:hypothetical protein